MKNSMGIFLLIPALVFLFLSCSGDPKVKNDRETNLNPGEVIEVDKIRILSDKGSDFTELGLITTALHFYPENNLITLDIPFQRITYSQYWDTASQQGFVDSVKLYLGDYRSQSFSEKGKRSLRAYSNAETQLNWKSRAFPNGLKAIPYVEMGYYLINEVPYFAVTVREAWEINHRDRRIRSPRLAMLFDQEQAEYLAGIFNNAIGIAKNPHVKPPIAPTFANVLRGINDYQAPIVCLGDSVTAGYSATTLEEADFDNAYPAFLQKKVNVPVVNAGVIADTTIKAISRIERDVLIYRPQIVIVNLGLNDFFTQVQIPQTETGFRTILNAICDGIRKVYICKFFNDEMLIIHMNGRGFNDPAFQNGVIAQYNKLLNQLVNDYDLVLIEDIWKDVYNVDMVDGIHPTAAGNKTFSNNIFDVLRPYLEEKNLLKKSIL
ncbi:hypothetical protein FACS189447_04350 [Spirochaetia bacterium]|nr:hypothetical protein FACS189447_04350 [Spirochaetia bacterium]